MKPCNYRYLGLHNFDWYVINFSAARVPVFYLASQSWRALQLTLAQDSPYNIGRDQHIDLHS